MYTSGHMRATTSKSQRRLLDVVCVLLSVHFAIAYNTLTSPMVAFAYKELSGQGGAFAYRMLPALLWQATVFLLSPLHRRFPARHLPRLNAPFTSDEGWFVVLLTFAAMLGTLQIARRLLRGIDARPGFEWMALGMAYMAYFDTMLVLNRNLYYPYDLTALFFFMLLVYLAYRDRPGTVTLVLLFAVLNKETAAMAVPLYLGLNYGRRPLGRLLAWCCGMGAVVFAVRMGEAAHIHHVCPICRGSLRIRSAGICNNS